MQIQANVTRIQEVTACCMTKAVYKSCFVLLPTAVIGKSFKVRMQAYASI